MNTITIKLNQADAQILRNDLEALVMNNEALKKIALKRMQDETSDEFEKECASENLKMLTYKIETYRYICRQILKSLFLPKQ